MNKLKFGERLKELREEQKLSQEQFGKLFNVKGPSVSRWETGQMEPDYQTLVNLAIYFKVTTDYLLGLED